MVLRDKVMSQASEARLARLWITGLKLLDEGSNDKEGDRDRRLEPDLIINL